MRIFTAILVLVLVVGCGSLPSSDGGTGGSSGGGDSTGGGTATGGGEATGGGTATADGGFPTCGPSPLPAACADLASTAPAAGDFGATGTFAVVVETLANPEPRASGSITIYLPMGRPQAPVLFFAHAFGATSPALYDPLFRQLASNGFAVVQVPYPTIPGAGCDNGVRYAVLWSGFTTAAAHYTATQSSADAFDLTRVGFFGHSFGAGATPEMARRGFVDRGWGANGRMMFIMAPWYSWGSGYQTLPSNTKVVMQVYADDETNAHDIALIDIWLKLPPGLERAWQQVRTDVCGACGLNSGHTLPMQAAGTQNPQSTMNSYDRWAVFRRVHALAGYALEQNASARDIAFGTEPSMGAWVGCAGRAVRPLESSAMPEVSTCRPAMFSATARAQYADDAGCP